MANIIHDLVRYNHPMELDFSELLSRRLPTSQLKLIRSVADEAKLHGVPLYAVGGLPRDLVLGVEHSDMDLVVEGDAIALARGLAANYGGEVTAHARFGTARWALRGTVFEHFAAIPTSASQSHSLNFLDLISARSETYDHPAALPTVTMGSIGDDLGRRDFTINALAIRLDGAGFGQVRDDFGGLKDLRQRVVRVLNAHSFVDDPTRMYRAARYEQRFGFRIADETLALIPTARGLAEKLSGQRIRHELDLILEEESAESILSRLGNLKLLGPIHADLPQDKVSFSRVKLAREAPAIPVPGWTCRNAAWLLWLLALHEDRIASLHERLHFTEALARACLSASGLLRRLPTFARWRTSKCVEYLDKLPPLAVYAVSRGARPGRARLVLENYLSHWRLIRPSTTGRDLKRLGLAPGPAYAAILRALRRAWLDGQVRNVDEERRLLRSMMLRHSRPLSAAQASPRRSRTGI